MECNKDEAARAKEIAEKKFLTKDIAGAKKFAVKAQNLYPGLEGISQMLATLDVYVSAENKINGEADRYGILGVDPLADEETVRKHYRKLALMLHPDKNKSVGADGAFKLISEAWSLLSDKAKRLAYDQKRSPKVSQQKAQPQSGVASASPGQNGFYNFTKSKTSHVKVPKNNTTKVHASSVPASTPKQRPDTFWTVCHRCKMQYEYLRIYLKHNLLCPNCHEAFFAIETAPPSSSSAKVHSQQQHNSNHRGVGKNVSNTGRNNSSIPPDSSNNINLQWGPFSGTTGAASSAQAASMVQQAYEKVKRERELAQAAKKREEALQKKNRASKRTGSGPSSAAKRRRDMEDLGAVNIGRNITAQMRMGTGGATTTSSHGMKPDNFEQGRVGITNKPYNTRDASNVEIQQLLMEKARKEICKKLDEWRSHALAKTAVKVKETNDKAKEKDEDNAAADGSRQDKSMISESIGTRKEGLPCHFIPCISGGRTNKEPVEPMSINVPDPDFYDFDRDRTERCFGVNQVWAAYDIDDGMPRYYAMIHDVISLNPFKLRISWLNSTTNSKLGPLNWVGSGFSKSCGDFRIGKHEITRSLNSFSHKVSWTKGTRGAIQIFPKKGDVWALYRNWSAEWNELTAVEVIHKYDMVEVLEEYDEELGMTVIPLIKVAGFKTVFHRHLNPREERRIPREEMFRFSHHVPSCLLTGQEAPNAPKGCWELDPAATPSELLQVITDVNEADFTESGEVRESIVDGVEKTSDRGREENISKTGHDIPENSCETRI